jgi:hypothetical protein
VRKAPYFAASTLDIKPLSPITSPIIGTYDSSEASITNNTKVYKIKIL